MRVALVGRVNAGKSSLFNRLVGRSDFSVVSPEEGVTRDWREAESRFGWQVIDTPGLVNFRKPFWWDKLQPDLYLWTLDGSLPPSHLDLKVADWLRGKPALVCLNKSDLGESSGFYDMGFQWIKLSAKTGAGISDLVSALEARQVPDPQSSSHKHSARFMIVGQPNAGKSSLLNALYGEARAVVSEEPGTTVDVVEVECELGRVQDTPGVKRKKYGGFMKDALANLWKKMEAFKGILLLVIDATRESVSQDLRLAKAAWETGNPLLILLNKWDLVRGEVSREWIEFIRAAVPGARVLSISTLTGANLNKISREAALLREAWSGRVGTGALNAWFSRVLGRRDLPVKYISQVDTCPPKLLICGKRLREENYRFICRKFREEFNLGSVPIKVEDKFY